MPSQPPPWGCPAFSEAGLTSPGTRQEAWVRVRCPHRAPQPAARWLSPPGPGLSRPGPAHPLGELQRRAPSLTPRRRVLELQAPAPAPFHLDRGPALSSAGGRQEAPGRGLCSRAQGFRTWRAEWVECLTQKVEKEKHKKRLINLNIDVSQGKKTLEDVAGTICTFLYSRSHLCDMGQEAIL